MVYPREQLFACYPNPANTELLIGFHLLKPHHLTLEVLDLQGKRVVTIFDGKSIGMGYHRERFMLNELQNGTYVYHLYGEGFDQSQRFVVQR
jgi:hypothetical protein